MTGKDFEAFQRAWEESKAQGEGGVPVPDRAGFKCGWFAALQHRDKEIAELKEVLIHAEKNHEYCALVEEALDKYMPRR